MGTCFKMIDSKRSGDEMIVPDLLKALDTYNDYYRLTVCPECDRVRKEKRRCRVVNSKRYCDQLHKARVGYFKEALDTEIMGRWCGLKVGLGKVLLPGEVFPVKDGWEQRFARKFERIKKVVENSRMDVEQDIVVDLPPKKQYTIRAKIKSVTKGEPSVVREDD
jgi:hypothetical protein